MLFFNRQTEFASQEELDAMVEWNKNNPTPDMNWDQLMAQEPAIGELFNPSPEEDRHITIEEGIAWLTRIGCTDVRALGNHLITGVMADGFAFTTDIREHNAVDVWRDMVIAKYADEEQPILIDGQIETYTEFANRVAIVPSFVEGQSAIVRSDFAKLYPMSAPYALIQWGNGGMGYGWYLTTQPIDAKRIPVTLYWDNGKFIPSARFEQLPYEPTKVQYFPTPSQIEHLDAQLEYWNARRYAAELAGDGDEEEFCSLFVLTVQSLLFV